MIIEAKLREQNDCYRYFYVYCRTNYRSFAEPQEPDNDDQPVGGAVLAGLQAQVGPGGVWRGEAAPRAQ